MTNFTLATIFNPIEIFHQYLQMVHLSILTPCPPQHQLNATKKKT